MSYANVSFNVATGGGCNCCGEGSPTCETSCFRDKITYFCDTDPNTNTTFCANTTSNDSVCVARWFTDVVCDSGSCTLGGYKWDVYVDANIAGLTANQNYTAVTEWADAGSNTTTVNYDFTATGTTENINDLQSPTASSDHDTWTLTNCYVVSAP